MPFHDALRDGDPQPRPTLLRREERLAHPRQILRGDAQAVVDELDAHVTARSMARADREGPALFHGFEGVGDQVEPNLPELLAVADNVNGVLVPFHSDPRPLATPGIPLC